jgi:hypothetical protein
VSTNVDKELSEVTEADDWTGVAFGLLERLRGPRVPIWGQNPSEWTPVKKNCRMSTGTFRWSVLATEKPSGAQLAALPVRQLPRGDVAHAHGGPRGSAPGTQALGVERLGNEAVAVSLSP